MTFLRQPEYELSRYVAHIRPAARLGADVFPGWLQNVTVTVSGTRPRGISRSYRVRSIARAEQAYEEVGPSAAVLLPYTPSSVAEARHRLVSDLAAAGVYETTVGDAALVITELLSNAIRHAAPLPGALVRVTWTVDRDAVRVAVSDAGDGPLPHVTEPAPGAPGGRGLGIVETLADHWGVQRDNGETTVWALLAAPPVPARPAVEHPPAEPVTAAEVAAVHKHSVAEA
jgi:anti-sigma regulatory factor (Ser/Thr protein kinase)